MVDKGVTIMYRLSGLRFMKTNSNQGLWWELEEDFYKEIVHGWTLKLK
jgi:hypothetical protein